MNRYLVFVQVGTHVLLTCNLLYCLFKQAYCSTRTQLTYTSEVLFHQKGKQPSRASIIINYVIRQSRNAIYHSDVSKVWFMKKLKGYKGI